jgi:hypothetical protein
VVAYDPAIPRLSPTHFLANGNVLSLAGTTTPDAAVEVHGSDDAIRAATVSNGDGLFRLNVPLSADEEAFTIAVVAPSGFATRSDFAVTIDRDAPEIVLDPPPPWLTAAETVRIAGTSDPAARLALNGTAITNDAGRFDEAVTLAPGENLIELIATDPAGNVRVEKVAVRLDREPPSLVGATSRPSLGGQPSLAIEVEASDASGLAKAAPFEVVSGDSRYRGYLRYSKAAKLYRGTVLMPEADLAEARLTRLELEDDAGNRRVFEFND